MCANFISNRNEQIRRPYPMQHKFASHEPKFSLFPSWTRHAPPSTADIRSCWQREFHMPIHHELPHSPDDMMVLNKAKGYFPFYSFTLKFARLQEVIPRSPAILLVLKIILFINYFAWAQYISYVYIWNDRQVLKKTQISMEVLMILWKISIFA